MFPCLINSKDQAMTPAEMQHSFFILILAEINFLYSIPYGVNHPKEQQGKKENRTPGTVLPFYIQIGANQPERAMKCAVLIHPLHSLSMP